ncbi:MAG: AEC family transporter [Anaerolineae bacterium]|nr:AEC family transporter [Anaerolineae bacterium]
MIYSNILLSIAPIFILIIVGYGLRRGGFPSTEFWHLNNKLVYWVLIPALLFSKISTIPLSNDNFLLNTFVIYSGFGMAVLFALLSTKVLRLNGSASSSILQGSARHNSFIGLAVAERLFGADGLSQAALVTAVLIPITNIVIVTLMVLLIKGTEEKGVISSIQRDIIRNPLIIAVVVAVGLNILDITPIPVIDDLTDILGRAALPIMLLGVGANIRVRNMAAIGLPVWASIAGKMIIFPGVTFLAAQYFGLPKTAALVVIIFSALPTAASSYTLARQMGGDAQLMASIITIQTALSFLSLPLTIALAQNFF